MGYGEFDALFEEGVINKEEAATACMPLLNMLEDGRVDAIFGNIHVFPYAIQQAGGSVDNLKFSEVPIFEFDLQTQVNKEYTEFLDDYNQFIRQSKEDGFLDGIVESWIGTVN